MNPTRSHMKDKQRIVVKIGSSSITHKETGGPDYARLEVLSRELADLRNQGKDVVLVSSGAIATGRSVMHRFGARFPSPTLAEKQAYAAVGQAHLMMAYQRLFSEYGQVASQVLLTKEVITNDLNRYNAHNTFTELLKMCVIPIVNENDTTVTYEIEFGDNDTLSAVVTALIDADLLILLSDIDGLYTDDPRVNPDAEFIETVEDIDDSILSMGKESTGSRVGTGGMNTKLTAARIATQSGADMVIASSEDIKVISRIINGENVGTLFKGNRKENFDLVDILNKL